MGPMRTLLITPLFAALALFPLPLPAQAAAPPVPSSYFGLHHAGLHADGARGFPQTEVGSVRLWDNGVSWREIERSDGVFSWARLDALVSKSRANGASVLLVLGQTPRFHSTRPGVRGAYGRGASAMPTQASWFRYVKAVAQRNENVWGNSVALQVWNESNAAPYWSGTPRQMAQLTAWTRQALNQAGSSAHLVGPAMVTRLSSQQAYINAFYGQRIGGRNVSTYVDALSFQLYPVESGTPEASMALLRQVRAILSRYNVRKPIYNTEINYGLVGGPRAGAPARRVSSARQVGNVLRTYVLNAQNNVGRVYWYAWDLQGFVNTKMVFTNGITTTPAGRAFATARSWMLGYSPAGCTRNRAGTYTCTFRNGTEVRRVVWNPNKRAAVRAPAGTTAYVTGNDVTRPAVGGTRVYAGQVPFLFRGSR